MGRNGVGKTTTLKSIVGLTRTDAGSIRLGDNEMLGLKPDQRARLGLGYYGAAAKVVTFFRTSRSGKT